MRIAVAARGADADAAVDPRFGRAAFLVVHDTETGTYEALPNTVNLQAAQGAGIQTAAAVVNTGCTALIAGHCGPKAFTALAGAGITVYACGSGTVRQAVEALVAGKLKPLSQADRESHW
jgi:predicted Fe-Mo cluster-binding NifX family protein